MTLPLFDSVLLGARRKTDSGSTSEFEWTDGSPIEYSNWSPGSPTNDSEKACAQLNSHLARGSMEAGSSKVEATGNGDGLWSNVSCVKRNLVLCQKPQTWSLLQMQKNFIELREKLEQSMEEQKEAKANPGKNFELFNNIKNKSTDVSFPFSSVKLNKFFFSSPNRFSSR